MHPWLLYGEHVQIATYPAVIVAAFCAATFVLRREALRSALPTRAVMDAAVVGILVGAVGARAFHVFVEAPARYWADPLAAFSPFGAWTFYGGLVGGLLGVGLAARWQGHSPWRMLDVFAVAIPFGQALSRLGCLASGCCYGRVADWPFGVAVPWAITIDGHGQLPPHLLAVPLHPAQLYLSLLGVALFVLLSRLRERAPPDGVVFGALLVGYGIGRAAVDAFRGDVARGLWLGDAVSSAQGMGVLAAAVGVWVLLRRGRAGREGGA